MTASVARELVQRGHEVRILTGHPAATDLDELYRRDKYNYENLEVYRFNHAYVSMGGQTSMIEVGYDNHLAANYFGEILDEFKPDLVHFFHFNRLGTGLIEQALSRRIRRFMTPTDFWAICPTGQLVCADGTLCGGPSKNAGNCVKHFAQNSARPVLVRVISKALPVSSADLLVRLAEKGVLSKLPLINEIKAMGGRLSSNVTRLNQLNAIVAPNRFMREKLVEFGVNPELIVESAFGVDVPQVENVPLLQVDNRRLRLGFVGTLAPHKGCHVLLKAFAELPKGSADLKIYGAGLDFPEYYAELKKLASVQENVEFCGVFHRSEISAVMAGVDVLVVPSMWYENTPLVIYSAQALHRVVVASNFPGISEVVVDESNGLLFEPGNIQELVRQLKRLIDSSGLLVQLSNNIRQPKSTSTYVDELLAIWSTAQG